MLHKLFSFYDIIKMRNCASKNFINDSNNKNLSLLLTILIKIFIDDKG